ncbi:hypothetical protein [Nostoc sp. CHAB 5715]|uniref:hypothetical protein n=1 Tax=Nostoc sp. CHAB 5715 TaxID=2780400 RepID=UPI001E3BBEB4|nr:hypothetical protein [Nostoc sp. CHAB 5715]MCC5622305.1 hypothetical protein [Nostoc sp. CHAB 5715]
MTKYKIPTFVRSSTFPISRFGWRGYLRTLTVINSQRIALPLRIRRAIATILTVVVHNLLTVTSIRHLRKLPKYLCD